MLTITHLVKKFGDLTAVDDITFEVPDHSIFAFLGPNGAGKSTTIKMLTTLLHPTSGQMTIAGIDPVKHPAQARKNFGIVFQDPSLDDELTAYENMEFHGVLYGVEKKLRRARIEELLNVVELWDRRGDLVKHFSGGMKRRLEIARGLLHHPKVLFLDEPTIGLDPQTRNHIWEYVKEINRQEGITVFFTTHYMEEADRVAQAIAVIDHGKIIEQGTSEEIKAKTKTTSLEDAFIALTGNELRAEKGTAIDQLRMRRRAWGGR